MIVAAGFLLGMTPRPASADIMAGMSSILPSGASDVVRALRSSFTGTTNTIPQGESLGFQTPSPVSGVAFGFLLDRMVIQSGTATWTIVTPFAVLQVAAPLGTSLILHAGLANGYDSFGGFTGDAFAADLLGASPIPGLQGVEIVLGSRILQSVFTGTAVMPIFGIRVVGGNGLTAGKGPAGR